MIRALIACLGLAGCVSVSGLDDFELEGGAGAGGDAGGTTSEGGAGLGGAGGSGGEAGAAACQPGDIRYEAEGRCYRLVEDAASYPAGEMICGQIVGGHLAALSTLAELDAVLAALQPLPSAMWIGGDDRAREGVFAWLNGEPFTYAPMLPPWGDSEPNNAGGTEHCIEVIGSSIPPHFNDDGCTQTLPFLCEYAPAPR